MECAVLSDEIETTMRLLGVTSLDQLNEFYINTSAVESELTKTIDLEDGKGGFSSKL
jgi:L-lactate dehydrogenase (cytochrome)